MAARISSFVPWINSIIVEQKAPSADFSYATSALMVKFRDQSTDEDGCLVEWNWDFDNTLQKILLYLVRQITTPERLADLGHERWQKNLTRLYREKKKELAELVAEDRRVEFSYMARDKFIFSRLKPGGKICYSTCSIQMAENSKLVENFLKINPNFSLESEQLTLPSSEGFDHDGGYVAILVRQERK